MAFVNNPSGVVTDKLHAMGLPMLALSTTTVGTVADAGTATDAQHLGGVFYQDASGGSVTWTTRTGTQLAAAFASLAIGEAVFQFVASNHATNTTTVSGGTGVTVVGSGAVTRTGGTFLLLKTAAATFDLIRVG